MKTPEDWVHELDLPNLLRYGTHEHIKGIITAMVRRVIDHERMGPPFAEKDRERPAQPRNA